MAGGDMSQARAPKVCPECGREVSANNLARHLGTHGIKSETPKRTRKRKQTSGSISRGIGRYLDAVEYGAPNGLVSLGALDGFPGTTRDPEVVARAIEVIRGRADEGSAVQRLKRQQRIITLTRQLETLETEGTEDDAHAFFVEHAAEWAEENGVGYSAFRAMGVAPSVLAEAGITRTFEP